MTVIETVRSVATAENPVAGLSPYERRHLVPHMRAGGLDEYIHSLLGLDSITTDEDGVTRRHNAWFELKTATDDLAGFLSDVHTAWELADMEAAGPRDEDIRGRGIGRGIRYALIQATLASRAANIPPGLLAALVRRGVWSGERAIASVLQLSDHEELAAALESLGGTFVVAGRADDFLVASERLDEAQRARVLASLARVAHSAELVNRVVGEAESIEDERQRVRVLMVASASSGAVGRVIHAAAMLSAEEGQVAVLAACAPVANAEQRAAISSAAAAMSAGAKTQLYAALAPVLDPAETKVALAAMARLRSSTERLAISRSLADRLPEAERSSWLAAQRALISKYRADDRPLALAAIGDVNEAVHLAKRIRGARKRVQVLARLAQHMRGRDLGQVLNEVLAHSRALTPHEQGRVIAGLAPHLPTRLVPKALRITRGIDHSHPRTKALVALALRLPERSVGTALSIAVDLKDLELRGRALRALAPRLSFTALDDLVVRIGNARMPGVRPHLLANIVDHLAEEHVRSAFAWTVRIGDPSDRAAVIGVLAPQLPDDLLEEALARLEHVGDSASSLEARSRLAAQGLSEAVADIVDGVLAQRPSDHGIAVLASLAPTLTDGHYGRVAHWLRWRTGAYGSPESMMALAPGLTRVGADALLLEAMLARPLTLSAQQVAAMMSVVDQLSPALRERFLSTRREILAKGYLDVVDTERALREHLELLGRSWALPADPEWIDLMWPDPISSSARKHDLAIGTAGVGNVDRALAITRSIESIYWRVETLVSLADFVGPDDRAALISEVLQSLRDTRIWARGEYRYAPDYARIGLAAVGSLGPYLDRPTAAAFLDTLAAIADPTGKSGIDQIALRSVCEAEAGIARAMGREMRRRVLDRGYHRVEQMTDERLKELTLASLAGCLDVDWVDNWLSEVQNRLPPQRRAEAYRELAARLVELGHVDEALDVAIGIEAPGERQSAFRYVAQAAPTAGDLGRLWIADGNRPGLVGRLATRSRPVLLADIAAMAPTIAAAGGIAAIAEAYAAVEDVATWWP